MNKILPYLYLAGSLMMPTAYALAHGEVDDGHTGEAAVANPENRIYVMVGVGAVFALMIGWFVWSKIKSGAKPPEAAPPTV